MFLSWYLETLTATDLLNILGLALQLGWLGRLLVVTKAPDADEATMEGIGSGCGYSGG